MKPQIRTYELAHPWLLVCARFATDLAARNAFETITRKVKMTKGEGGVGVYRHGPSATPGILVSIVGLANSSEANVRKAARLLAAGEDQPLDEAIAQALIKRRAQVVVDHAGETGRLVIRRPEGRGAQLTASGDMIERKPGRG